MNFKIGESKVTLCDAVILATGYKVVFPYISHDILHVNNNKVRLYKHQFIHNLTQPHTLAFIGLVQPIGAIFPIAEMQSRWFALLMAGKCQLPTRSVMQADIDEKDRSLSRYYESERHTIQVDWVPFMDELAREIDVYPPLWKYLFIDFRLFVALVFGANASYQYRLIGPGAWSGAREAMLTIQDRIDAALDTNKQRIKSSNKLTNYNLFDLLMVTTLVTLVITSLVTVMITLILT